MTRDSEIVLLTDTYKLAEITSPESREQLVSTLRDLDGRTLSELELRKYFDTLKLAMGAFIHKVNALEGDIYTLRNEQRAAESRMESMYLRAQLEIQSLKQEIVEIKLSKGRINQIVKVAEALQGNAYAPYAIKSLVDGVVGKSVASTSKKVSELSTKLPTDYSSRLEFARLNGFKWNQNNREPTKDYKKLSLLEEWENQFCGVQRLTMDQILDKKLVSRLGSGAVAGALMRIEKELDRTIEARESLSVFNCYQKAIKLYQQRHADESVPAEVFDFGKFLSILFHDLSVEELEPLIQRFEGKGLNTPEKVLAHLKKIVSKKMLPTAFKYGEEHSTESSRLYAIQSGQYDDLLSKDLFRSSVKLPPIKQ